MPPFWPKTFQNQIFKKNIKLAQLGLRRGLWGHSFKSSYSLELILDFRGKSVFCVFYVFFLIPEILIPNTLDQNTWWGSHTWWAAHIHGGLASQQASFGGGPGWMGARGARGAGPGHHVCGLPTMYGFPTMYLASPPGILIKGIRYHVSGW